MIASLTWAFSLYLYSRLSQNTIIANPTMLAPDISFRGENNDKKFMLRDNVVISHDEALASKRAYNLKSVKDYRSNELLLQQLQPVPVKPAVTLDQGITFLSYLRLISVKFSYLRM